MKSIRNCPDGSFELSSELPFSADLLFDWHTRRGTIHRLIPPWEPVSIKQAAPSISDGSKAEFLLGWPPFAISWLAEHYGVVQGRSFNDRQLHGPFASWEHSHNFIETGPNRSILQDVIKYRLPFHLLTKHLEPLAAYNRLKRMFNYRHGVTLSDLSAHSKYGNNPLKIAITGATGGIGSSLSSFLLSGNHQVLAVSRSTQPSTAQLASTNIHWDPDKEQFNSSALEGCDGVVHLAGASIAQGRWTAERKRKIIESRVQSTKTLANWIRSLNHPPKVLVCASAIGYYGSRGDEILEEQSSSGTGFLADVCRAWEAEIQALSNLGSRVVTLRIGTVLDPAHGALKALSIPFSLGLGGKIGSGNQWMSWISLPDLLRLFYHALTDDKMLGVVNAVSPEPVTNAAFTQSLSNAVNRPTLLPLPSIAARSLFGEIADELLLSSTRVIPSTALAGGFKFELAQIDDALAFLYGRKAIGQRY